MPRTTDHQPVTLPLDPESVLTAPPLQELDDQARSVWQELKEVLDERHRLAREEKALKEKLRDILGRGSYAIGGEKVFDILPTRRWDEEVARAVLPGDVAHMLERVVIDRERAEKLLSPDWYRACQKEVGVDTVRPVVA